MTYLTIDQINNDITYAPIDFEEDFRNRLANDILKVVKQLNPNVKIRTSLRKINAPIEIKKLVDYYIDSVSYTCNEEYDVRELYYREDTNLQYYALWDDKVDTKPKTFKGHRRAYKKFAIKHFHNEIIHTLYR